MGRMLETLKFAAQRLPSAELKPTSPANLGECVMDWTMSDENQGSYIEVGGPNKKIDASADVLAVQPAHQPPLQPPHGVLTEVKKAITSAPQWTPATSMGVAFLPWPGPTAPSRGVSPDIIAHHQPDHPVSKQYGLLLEQILQAVPGGASAALLIAGVKPEVGATTVLLNLAVLGATQLKRRVAVLDGNLRRPSLADRLGFIVPAGIVDVLAGTEALDQILRAGPIAGLHVLPGRALKDDESLTAEAAGWLVGWLRERFDLVLIDGPTLDETAHLALWTPFVQAVFAVAQHNDPVAQKSLSQNVARLGGRLRGVIHTHLE